MNFFQKSIAKGEKLCYNGKAKTKGPLVKRLRRSPLKAESWVRFPYGSPEKEKSELLVRTFLFSINAKGLA